MDEMIENEENQAMALALAEADACSTTNDVPVGAVITCAGRLVTSARNRREADHDATAHAEILAIRQACEILGRRRLSDCTLIVTLEPCPMCAGAILAARIGRVVYGVKDPNGGAFGSVLQFNAYPLGFRPEIIGGVREEDCRNLLQAFFVRRRKNRG